MSCPKCLAELWGKHRSATFVYL